jgi:hypothetical protein
VHAKVKVVGLPQILASTEIYAASFREKGGKKKNKLVSFCRVAAVTKEQVREASSTLQL